MLNQMIRKMAFVGVCYGASFLLMGAGEVYAMETSNSDFVAATQGADFTKAASSGEEESLATGSVSGTVEKEDTMEETVEQEDVQEEVQEDVQEDVKEEKEELLVPNDTSVPVLNESSRLYYFQVDEKGVPMDIEVENIKGSTYVPLLAMAQVLDETAVCTWDASSNTATVKSAVLSLTAVGGQLYLEANGRYLYIEDTLSVLEGDLLVPLAVLTKAFDAQLSWYEEGRVISVVTGSGGILSGDEFYDADDLFWLSRVIFAESGNQPLEGQMGVAMVVNNRIADSWYPDTVVGVLAQKNQFSTYKNGALADRTPNASSIIAAKLVMDGGVVKEIAHATHFDSISGSWASYNLKTIMVIGGHTFYG